MKRCPSSFYIRMKKNSWGLQDRFIDTQYISKEFMNEKDIKTKSDKEDSEDFQFNIDYHKE